MKDPFDHSSHFFLSLRSSPFCIVVEQGGMICECIYIFHLIASFFSARTFNTVAVVLCRRNVSSYLTFAATYSPSHLSSRDRNPNYKLLQEYYDYNTFSFLCEITNIG